MTLDEAIKQCQEVAEENQAIVDACDYYGDNMAECEKCGEEHRQLAEWLKDYKRLLEQQPSDETIKYLECNDIDVQEFTEAMKKQRLQVIKPNICDDCVSRQAVLNTLFYKSDNNCEVVLNKELQDRIKALPPVTPTQCIAEVRFSKDDLREICNERIEIECTHGTCKDCEYWHKEGKYCTNLTNTMGWSEDEYYQVWTDEDFYCKDFKKRGSEE